MNRKLIDAASFVAAMVKKHCKPCKEKPGHTNRDCIYCILFDVVAEALDAAVEMKQEEFRTLLDKDKLS